VDESPIPALQPQQEAELLFKMDVSKDAVPGKRYQLKVIFEFSDSYRDDLSDAENAYLQIEQESSSRPLAAVLLLVVLAAILIVIVKRRSKS
jgi:hypothetical protein